MSTLRQKLNARGLAGDDLETMIDHYLELEAGQYEFWTLNEIVEEFGSGSARLVMAFKAIAKES